MNRRDFLKNTLAVAALGTAAGLSGQTGIAQNQSDHATRKGKTKMKHKCKITVIKKECYPELQKRYLADPKSGPCPFFEVGQEFLLEGNDFFRMMNGRFCAEAWDAVSRYVYAALQGGSIMKGWTNDEKVMIACCNDGTRPVVFKIERIDVEEPDSSEDSENSRQQ